MKFYAYVCVPFTYGGGLVFIMDDHDNFPNWIMIPNSSFLVG